MLKIYNGSENDIEIQKLKTFVIDDSLFPRMQKYVQENNVEEGTVFSVLDKTEKRLFLVIYQEDLIAGIKRKDLSDYLERLKNIDDLDFTLVDQYKKFFFLDVDNYSVAVAKLLLRHRPNTKIVFGDAKARYFFKEGQVKYLSSLYNAGRHMELTEKWMRGECAAYLDRLRALIGWKMLGMLKKAGDCCIVKADRRNHPGSGGEGVVYNSQNVVYSLIWKKSKRYFGEKNPDKQIIVLDYSCGREGIGSIAGSAFTHVMWMTGHGYVPVMNLHTYPNQYLNAPGENMWEYFFEPVSSVSVDDAYESENVIIATENDITRTDFHISPYQRKYVETIADYAADYRKIVRMNRETKQYIDEKVPKEIREGKRVLGVVMRGSDLRRDVSDRYHRKKQQEGIADAEAFLRACSYYKDQLKCEYIFLATEDAEYLEMAQSILDKILFVDQKRTAYDYANGENITLNEAMGQQDGKAAGRDYLSVIQCLTECRALLCNMMCGAVRLSQLWKTDKYELFRRIGRDGEQDLDK